MSFCPATRFGWACRPNGRGGVAAVPAAAVRHHHPHHHRHHPLQHRHYHQHLQLRDQAADGELRADQASVYRGSVRGATHPPSPTSHHHQR